MALSIVTFKWHTDFRTYTSEHVNYLFGAVDKYLTVPHRFICVTNEPEGLCRSIEVMPLWKEPDIDIGEKYPINCYKRLKVFSKEARGMFGEKVLMLDLDTVIVRNINHLVSSKDDFIAWNKEALPYQGGIIFHRTGTRTELWDDFKGLESREQASIYPGSDQAWISYKLGPGERTWGKLDGIYSYSRNLKRHLMLPRNCSVIMFHGRFKPWNARPPIRNLWVSPWKQYVANHRPTFL